MKKDVNLTFNRNPFSNDLSSLDRKSAIKQKVYTFLMLESPGTIVYKDYLYTGLKKILGDNVSNINASILKEIIKLACDKYIPEIELIDISVIPDWDNQKYKITLKYSIVNSIEIINQSIVLVSRN